VQNISKIVNKKALALFMFRKLSNEIQEIVITRVSADAHSGWRGLTYL